MYSRLFVFTHVSRRKGGRGSAVSIGSHYRLDGKGAPTPLGNIFRTHSNRAPSPPSLLYHGNRVSFPGISRPERCGDNPPRSNTTAEDGYCYSYTSTGSQCLLAWRVTEQLSLFFFIIQKSAELLHVSHNAGKSQWVALVRGISEPMRPE